MESGPKSRTQQLFTRFVSPAGAARLEAESRTWKVRCPRCGYERSAWDMGSVIYKGAGTRYWYMRCPNCGKRSWHKVYWPAGVKKSDVYAAAVAGAGAGSGAGTGTGAGTAAVPALSDRPPWLLWVVAALLWIGLIAAAVLIFTFLLINLVINPLTQPVASVGDSFMAAAKAGNYEQAYSLCSPDLQKQVGGVGDLARMFQGNQPGEWSWSSRSVTNGVGYLDGSLTYADGRRGSAHLTLRQVNNQWKVVAFSMNPG